MDAMVQEKELSFFQPLWKHEACIPKDVVFNVQCLEDTFVLLRVLGH